MVNQVLFAMNQALLRTRGRRNVRSFQDHGCAMLPDALYLKCDLPASVRALDGPELRRGSQAEDAVLEQKHLAH